MSKPPIGVAVVGAGSAGRLHALGYRLANTISGEGRRDARLVSVADPNVPLASTTAREFGFERADTSWEAVVADPEIDAVSVVVANHLHREVVEALLAAGKHVLCEKPLAPTVEDGAAMAAAATTALGIARVGFTYRRQAAVQAIREVIDSGRLGRPVHFSASYWSDYAADPSVPMTWRYLGGPGSGALADIGSHIADLSEFFCGRTESIVGADFRTVIPQRPVPIGQVVGHQRAALSGEFRDVDNEDSATWSTRFESGATGSFSVSRVARGLPNSLRFEILCEGGAASYDNGRPGEFSLVESREVGYQRVLLGTENTYASSVGFGSQQGFTSQARSFLDEIDGVGTLPPGAPLDVGVQNLRLQVAIVEAARTRASVSVPVASDLVR